MEGEPVRRDIETITTGLFESSKRYGGEIVRVDENNCKSINQSLYNKIKINEKTIYIYKNKKMIYKIFVDCICIAFVPSINQRNRR